MGDYADYHFEQGFDAWIDEGCPSIPVIKVNRKVGDKCTRVGCKGHYVERTNRRTGDKFLGCSAYPKCNSTS